MVICLEQGADLHMAQLMPLPLTASCFSKIQIGFTFLVPAHLGSPGKGAVKRVCVCARAFYLLGECVFLFCVRFSFFQTKPRDRLVETSLKWPILCRVGRKTTAQSVSQSAYSDAWCGCFQMTCWSNCGTGRRSGSVHRCLRATPTTSCRLSSIPRTTTRSPVAPSIEQSRSLC